MADQGLTMTKGDTGYLGLEYQGVDQPLDEAFFTCRSGFEGDIIFQKTLSDGIEPIDTEKEGVKQYFVRIAPEDTADVTAGEYYYDFKIVINGDDFTVLRGILQILGHCSY